MLLLLGSLAVVPVGLAGLGPLGALTALNRLRRLFVRALSIGGHREQFVFGDQQGEEMKKEMSPEVRWLALVGNF